MLHATIDGKKRTIALAGQNLWRIGRAHQCEIAIDDHRASRLHATISRDGDGAFQVSDAGSRNGPTINGRLLSSPTRLNGGDVVRIGETEFVFRDDPGAASAPLIAAAAPTEFYLSRDLVSVLVLDIRGFTALSLELGEERVSAMASDFFRIGGDLIERRGCWAQKYIGDAVMAVWRHASPSVTREELRTYLALVDDFVRLAEMLTVRFDLPAPLQFGGALNTGYAATGNMGSGGVADFTAIGDAVNKAFRLEAGTRELKCDFLIDEESMKLVVPAVLPGELPPLCRIMLRGYSSFEPVYAFDLARLRMLVAQLDR